MRSMHEAGQVLTFANSATKPRNALPYGIPVARCDIGQFGSQKVLVVERFDRQIHSSGKYWLRLVQEDFCQATATPSSMKYERDGGQGVLEIARAGEHDKI
jgi:serine/threonine protein kinase HipA of HipAB toxin-antitoxin module